MDGDSWSLVLLLLLLLGAAYCASSEIAYASLDLFKTKKLAEQGNRKAKNALYIANNFDQALTTILIGNNITHIGFASVATALATRAWGVKYVPLVTLLSTIIVFFFSEMLPKAYAKGSFNHAMRVSTSLRMMMRLFAPLNYGFSKISALISKLLKSEKEPDITEEDFLSLVETVKQEGVLSEQKQQLFSSAIDFDYLTVKDAYQAIENLDMVDLNASIEEIHETVKESKFSRLPIYDGARDNIVGLLSAKSFLKSYICGEPIDIREMQGNLLSTDFDMPLDELLQIMSNGRNHLCIVKDDMGRVRGIISLEDILEELVGEIWDENDLADGAENIAEEGGL